MRKTLIALAVGALLAGPAFAGDEQIAEPTNTTEAPSIALTQEQVEGKIGAAGFDEFRGLEFELGVWQAEARGGDKQWVDIYVHPLSGKLFRDGAPSPLNQDEIEAKVTAAGYRNVHDVKFDHGIWVAEADNSDGGDVALRIDPDDGSVIGEAND